MPSSTASTILQPLSCVCEQVENLQVPRYSSNSLKQIKGKDQERNYFVFTLWEANLLMYSNLRETPSSNIKLSVILDSTTIYSIDYWSIGYLTLGFQIRQHIRIMILEYSMQL